MKFLHIADVHIGCWRDRSMKRLSMQSFERVCDVACEEDVDFVLLAGDLFHTALPSIDLVKKVFKQLRLLKNKGIPVYYIAGSHDYSPTGKTMLDIIEEANLGVDVTKGSVRSDGKLNLTFTEDKKTGVKLTGLIGKAGMLDQKDYTDLDRTSLEEEKGQKIFLFHTAIDELKPERLSRMESSSVSFLPKGFEYYAGGHVHIVRDMNTEEHTNVVYPGPLFPTTFRELEVLGCGSYVLYDEGEVQHKELHVKDVSSHTISCGECSPEEMHDAVLKEVKNTTVKDKIVTIRVKGTLIGGGIGDVSFRTIQDTLLEKGAFHVMRNTAGVTTESFDAEVVEEREQDEIEEEIIQEYSGQIEHSFGDEVKVTKMLFRDWNDEKGEGETNSEYEERVVDVADTIMSSGEEKDGVEDSETENEKVDLTSFM